MKREKRRKQILISCSMIWMLLLGAGSHAAQTVKESAPPVAKTNQFAEEPTTEAAEEPTTEVFEETITEKVMETSAEAPKETTAEDITTKEVQEESENETEEVAEDTLADTEKVTEELEVMTENISEDLAETGAELYLTEEAEEVEEAEEAEEAEEPEESEVQAVPADPVVSEADLFLTDVSAEPETEMNIEEPDESNPEAVPAEEVYEEPEAAPADADRSEMEGFSLRNPETKLSKPSDDEAWDAYEPETAAEEAGGESADQEVSVESPVQEVGEETSAEEVDGEGAYQEIGVESTVQEVDRENTVEEVDGENAVEENDGENTVEEIDRENTTEEVDREIISEEADEGNSAEEAGVENVVEEVGGDGVVQDVSVETAVREVSEERTEMESVMPSVRKEHLILRGGREEAMDSEGTLYFCSGSVKAFFAGAESEGSSSFGYENGVSRPAGVSACRVVRYSQDGEILEEKYLDNLALDGEEVSFSFLEEGKWQIFAQTENEQGEVQVAASPVILVDKTAPALEITGVSEDSSNNGKLSIRVSCRDDWYQEGTLSVELTGASGKHVSLVDHVEKVPGGAEVYLKDFPMDSSYDDHYVLRVTARDLAGNTAHSEMNFCVNRGGSAYFVTEETGEKLKEYYHNQAFPIVLQEINLDDVRHSSVRAVKEGKAFLLQEGTDYTVKSEVMEDGKIRNSYEIRPDVFAQDGSYQVMLSSEDMAHNLGDSVSGGVTVRFAIDRESPECLIHGMASQDVMEGENRWISIELFDNMKVEQAEIYLNGQIVAVYNAGELEELGGVCKLELTGKNEWQNLQVLASDAAGNQYRSGEIPFYLSSPAAGEGILPNSSQGTLHRSFAGSGNMICLILTVAGLSSLFIWSKAGKRRNCGKKSSGM